MLKANSELLYGVSNVRKKLQDSYELEALNTSIAPNEIVEMVKMPLSILEVRKLEQVSVCFFTV